MGAAIALKTGSGASTRRLRTHAIRRRAERKSRRILLAGAGALAFITAVPFSVAALTDTTVQLPGAETARGFLALMNDRSPGRRTSAELAKVKLAAKPKQRALGKIVTPEEAPPALVEAFAPPPEVLPMTLAPEVNPIISEFAPVPAPPRGPPGGGGGCCGGGGPNPPGPENPPENPPTTTPALPEPGTWAMMLLGFGMTGWMLRRQRRRPQAAKLSFS